MSSGASDFFVTKLGYNCGCSSYPVAGFKNGAATGKMVTYTYTGSTAADSVIWSFGDGRQLKITSGFTTPVSHTYPANINYNVCVTVYSGCGTNTFCKLAPLAINTISGMDGVRVYPNPANNYLQIEAGAPVSVVLTNAIGQRLLIQSIVTDSQNIYIGDLPSGIYILSLTAQNGERRNVQVIKQ